MTRQHRLQLFVFAIMALLFSAGVSAEQYAKGHGALEVFDGEGMSASPLWVQIWIGFMLATFATGLVFFAWKRPIARWAGGGFIAGALGGGLIFQMLGLPMLSGSIAIVHLLFWTPALVLLLMQRPFLNSDETLPYRIWSGVMTFVILFSFVFDIRDAAIYIDHFAGLGMFS